MTLALKWCGKPTTFKYASNVLAILRPCFTNWAARHWFTSGSSSRLSILANKEVINLKLQSPQGRSMHRLPASGLDETNG